MCSKIGGYCLSIIGSCFYCFKRKARDKQISTDANAALIATQSIANEVYGHLPIDTEVPAISDPLAISAPITAWQSVTVGTKAIATGLTDTIQSLSSIKDGTATFTVSFDGKAVLDTFTFTESGKTATWSATSGTWTIAAA
ncbi:MAG: hypothetical protein PHR92_11345 [Lachnospiraceae bacterium]|nr:hypothetical protein [Lachnospiraceae bacterium]